MEVKKKDEAQENLMSGIAYVSGSSEEKSRGNIHVKWLTTMMLTFIGSIVVCFAIWAIVRMYSTRITILEDKLNRLQEDMLSRDKDLRQSIDEQINEVVLMNKGMNEFMY